MIVHASSPLVSIIIPCYQQGHFLPQALESAIAQPHRPLEIVIVNDGSTDDTAQAAREWAARHPGLILTIEQTNQGQAAARAAGFALIRGEFMVLLDADDLLEPEMIAVCLETLRARPELAAVTGDAWLIDAAGHRLRPWPQRQTPAWPRVLRNNPFGSLAAVMARASAVRQAGGLAVPGTPGVEDWDLWARMARCGMNFHALGRPVAAYRQAPAGASHKARQMLDATIELLDRCRTEDPRLAGAGKVAPPIAEPLYLELRNGKVFKALGLALSCGTALAEMDALLKRLAPGGLSARYCRDQFLEGIHYGFFLKSEPKLPAELDGSGFIEMVSAALRERGLERFFPRHRAELARILAGPLRKRSLLARLQDRLFS